MTETADSFDELFDALESSDMPKETGQSRWQLKILSVQTAMDLFSPQLNVPYVGEIIDWGSYKGKRELFMIIGVDAVANAYSHGTVCIATQMIRVTPEKVPEGDPFRSTTSTFVGREEIAFLFELPETAPENVFEGMSFYDE